MENPIPYLVIVMFIGVGLILSASHPLTALLMVATAIATLTPVKPAA